MEFVNRKRFRDDESSEMELVHVKKLREDLLEILSDSDPDPTNLDLASVMKSFEEEIVSCGTVSPADPTSDSGESRPELGYLLEASDDDLGLPPTTTEFGESYGVGELWGFEDEIRSFDSLEFGDDEGRDFDGEFVALDGLFDYSDEVFVGSADFPWRLETLPAL